MDEGRVLGIDPGAKGAWVVLQMCGRNVPYVVGCGPVSNNIQCIIEEIKKALFLLFEKEGETFAYVEIPNGVGIYKSSYASYQQGKSHGAILSALEILTCGKTAIFGVDPRKWQQAAGVMDAARTKTTKKAVSVILGRLFQGALPKILKNEGLRDAALLAYTAHAIRQQL